MNQHENHLSEARSRKVFAKRSYNQLPQDDLVVKEESVRGSWNPPPHTQNVQQHCSTIVKSKLIQTSVKTAGDGYSSNGYMYKFLARCQKTQLAVTSVHIGEEVKLFDRFLKELGLRALIKYFEGTKAPDLNCLPRTGLNFTKKEDRRKYHDSVVYNSGIVQKVRTITQSRNRFEASIPALPQPSPSTFNSKSGTSSSPSSEVSLNRPVIELQPIGPRIAQPFIVPRPYSATSYINTMILLLSRPPIPRKKCAMCADPSCSGGAKRFMCINSCGSWQNSLCSSRYPNPPCPQKLN
ncbi:unnamed protein product [Mucor hiemalis]